MVLPVSRVHVAYLGRLVARQSASGFRIGRGRRQLLEGPDTGARRQLEGCQVWNRGALNFYRGWGHDLGCCCYRVWGVVVELLWLWFLRRNNRNDGSHPVL